MNVALPNGQQVEFPDGTRQEVIDAYLKLYPVDQKPTEEPGIGGWILGHLSKGAANTVQMLDNLASYDTSGMMQQSPETKAFLRNNRFARAVDEHPEKTWYGKLGAELVEFVPEMPLYAAGEGIALRGLSALPKVGKAAQWLTKAHPNEWGATNLVKGMGRAAVGGAAVGGTIGVDSSASLGEHLVKGVETGAEFGVAVGGLHYPMKGLGLVGKSIFRRLGKKATPEKVEAELEKRAEKDPKAAEELQALKNARADAEAEKPKVVDEGDLYVPGAKEEAKQGELFVDMPGEVETKKLNELGFDNATIEQKIREGKDQELIDALEKEVPSDNQVRAEQDSAYELELLKREEDAKASSENGTSVRVPEVPKVESPRQRRSRLIAEAKAKADESENTSVQNLNIEKEGSLDEFTLTARDKDGNIAGSVDVSVVDGIAYTEGLYTRETFQRKGVMSKLHDYILDNNLADTLDTRPELFTGEGEAFFNKYRELRKNNSRVLQETAEYPELTDEQVSKLKSIISKEVPISKETEELLSEMKKVEEEQGDAIAKAREALPKVEEIKNEEKIEPTEESKAEAADSLEERLKEPIEGDDEVDWDMLRDLEATNDPVAKALVEDIPSNELQFQDKLEGVIKDVIYKRNREKIAKKAEGKKGRRKKAEEAKPVEKVEVKGQALEDLQKEYEKLLEDEGLGMEAGREELHTESLESSFGEDDIHGLDFSDRSARFFDDIIDGVYRDSDGGYTLDNLGFHQIYEKLAPHVAKSATALYHMGKYVYMEGYKSFEAFAKRLKEVTGEAWNSVRRYARDAYNAAKEWNDRLGEGGWIRVGQGGGAKYDRVSDAYIGTGEGSGKGPEAYTGAYGWGHYFSEAKKVFEAYAERFGFSGTRYKIGDKILEGEFPEDFKYDLQDKNISSALEGAKKYLGATKRILKRYEEGAKADGPVVSRAKKSVEKWQDIVNILSEGGEISFEKVSSKHVHEFDLPDELNLMDLDNPLPLKQLKAIAKAFEPYSSRDERAGWFYEDITDAIAKEESGKSFGSMLPTGTQVQAELQNLFGGRNASKFLDEKAGIHGNTYIGDRWATEGEGARNYVIFADKHIPPPVNHYTLDLFGMEQIWEWGAKLVASRRAQKNAPSNGIIAEVNGKTLTAKDDAEFNEGFMRALANGIARATRARLMTPDFAYKDNERVSPLIFDLHKRLSEGLNAASKRNEAIRVADTMLREVEDRQALKRIIEGKEIPKSEKLRDAALIMRKEHEAVREKKKDSLRVEMLQNLNKHEFAVIAKVLAGKDISEAIAEYTPRDKLGRRMKSPIDRAVIEDIVKDYKAIDNWGLDNYFTHYEKGSLRIVSSGKLYAKAMSVEDAARKFIDLNKMYPELDFKLDTTNMIGELASGVSKRSYQLIHNDLVKGLESTLGDINKAVARRLANKALEGRFFVKPTKQFSPYTLDRRAKLQGEADPFEIVYHYMYSMEKKMALDPAIDAIRRAMARTEVVGQEPYTAKDGSTKMRDIKRPFLTADEAKYLETYVSDVKGRMYKEDEIVDGILKGFASPRAYSRFVARSREIEANLKFAYRPVAGFVNGMSGLGHVWTKVGARYTTEGAAFLRTEEGKAFIKEMEPYLGVSIVESATGELTTRGTFERMRLLPPPKTKVGEFGHKAIEPMAFFQAPELPVRKLTLAANYLMAKSEGMSEAAARDVAIKANWFQQFSYDIASLPELMRGPTGRLLTQFKPYLLKELEFISQLRGMEIARYAGMQIALGGPRGLIMLAKSVPILGAYYGWGELENYLNKEFPKASRGIGGALGVDISAPATFQFPQAMRDWLGPTLSDLTNLYTNVLSPTIDNIVNIGNPDNPDIAVGKTMKSAIPIFKHYANLWDQVVDKDGWVKDDRGRRLWHIDNMATFTAKSLAGAESLELARIRVYESNLRGKEKRLDDTKTDTVDNILDAIEAGKPIEQSDIDQMIRLGIKPQTLRRAYKFRVLDPKLRRTLMTEVIRRPEILEEYPDAGDLDK